MCSESRLPISHSKRPGVIRSCSAAEAAACSQRQSNSRTGSSWYLPLVSAKTFGPRTFGNQASRPSSSSESKWKPTSRYERGPQPEKNGRATSCAEITASPRRAHENAGAEPSCDKTICWSIRNPSCRRKRERGHDMAPKSPSPPDDPESIIEPFEQIV